MYWESDYINKATIKKLNRQKIIVKPICFFYENSLTVFESLKSETSSFCLFQITL